MSETGLAAELAGTRDALHRACYALLSLEWAVGHSSQPPTHSRADGVAEGFLQEARAATGQNAEKPPAGEGGREGEKP